VVAVREAGGAGAGGRASGLGRDGKIGALFSNIGFI
jgi:hypothetical protein